MRCSRSVKSALANQCLEGLGLMMAQALEANGAIVYIIGRRKEALDRAASTAVLTLLPGQMKILVSDQALTITLEAWKHSYNSRRYNQQARS